MAHLHNDKYAREPIAIVGSACRLPGGASSPSKLWELLQYPRDVLSEIPANRFSAEGFYHPDNAHHGTANVRHAHTLEEDIRVFDAQFFGIKPVEANAIDPQQRLLLETVYEGIEAAGISIRQLAGTQTAVYVGIMSGDYGDMLAHDQDNVPTYAATGSARSNVSSRISHFFDWHGPSISLDTACSSSLIAVHQAVQVLRSGDGTDVAVACGVNLVLNPDASISLSNLKMLSPEGRSRMWDSKANGYARGDGIAAVILKRLSQAIEDGDPIECVIRETQTNHDGKTKGIAMPSATAQTALIRAVYSKAGLDLTKPSDRPQFFEAHGTGTPTGDPIESEAIHTAFYSHKSTTDREVRDPMLVGSIKTVIGHTEGTAGIAAVMKASLALRHRIVPPNLLFDSLNPKLKRFYDDFEILKEARPWPALPVGAVPRVSVNSFGFGGANAHAILEAYDPDTFSDAGIVDSYAPPLVAVNFSAASESALRNMLRQYADFLDENPDISMRDLAWTLNTRRSTFTKRTSIYGATTSELSMRLRERADAESNTLLQIPSKTLLSSPRILGIFTGQGAQWARMGAEILLSSSASDSIIDALDRSLTELPDGPSWSIKDELLKPVDISRVNEAAISQPLCTAVQILLVDILRSAGVHFEAVVGHSSGEMGAAYAAGYLSATDAIRIAYYRGVHLHLAQGSNGEKGAMMAVGTSFEDAQGLCELPAFRGRIAIAASNSSASVTLSGDAGAIEGAKEVLEDEKKFVRLLKVDKAYHSHHMLACSDAYRKSLVDCKITVLRPERTGTMWVSSVYGEDAADYRNELENEYWIKNMVSPVLFSQALEFAAAEKAPFDAAIECGPHPALKGPALQVLQEARDISIPYTGLLSRGKNDAEAFADSFGYLWQALGERAVDYRLLDRFFAGRDASLPRVLLDLPTYCWDHERAFWHESRQYNANRTRADPIHELLGVKCPDGTKHQHRWRNMLRPSEVPWLKGHVIQSQIVVPAAGYLSTAFEAVKLVTKGMSLKTIEVEDFIIEQAFVFNDDNSSVETQFTLNNITVDSERWQATFSYYSASHMHTSVLERNAWGKISAVLGEPENNVLPPSSETEFNMVEVDAERFYEALVTLGFSLTGPFKSLGSLHRKLGEASGTIRTPLSSDPAYNLLMHPALLDSALQTIIFAYCYPNDGKLASVQLPIRITKITINPLLCDQFAGREVSLRFKSTITCPRSTEIEGDMELYDEQGNSALMQVEGLRTKPLGNYTAENDTPVFAEVTWDVSEPSRESSSTNMPDLRHKVQLCYDVERVAFYYLRLLHGFLTPMVRQQAEPHHKIFFEYIDHTVASAQNSTAKYTKREYFSDTHMQIQEIMQQYPESIDMKLMRAVGEHLQPVVRGETTMLEYMRQDNMLNEFYVHALGFDEYTECMAEQIRQFSHRYPRMNILEIGAGTGGATKRILQKVKYAFRSYTYTDISAGFFEEAKEVFNNFGSRMVFKPLNIEKDPTEQGFQEHSYDLVVASLVLHATHTIDKTMKNVRRLLKPGGYLVILELGDYIENRSGLVFGTLPGWWMGYDDGRRLTPAMSEEAWDVCMKKVGFSGVDSIVPIQPDLPISLQVIVSQAINDHVRFLRDPLAPNSLEVISSHLTIVGGTTSKIADIVSAAAKLLEPFYNGITIVKRLSELSTTTEVHLMGTVLCLTDLDEPIFLNMTEDVLRGAQQAFKQSRSCLWITQGCYTANPYQHMSVGMARVARLEMSHLRYQSLDLDEVSDSTSRIVVNALLQLEATEVWDQTEEGKSLLWSTEVELLYEKKTLFVPRLKTHQARNDRYNSGRRVITKEMRPAASSIALRSSNGAYELHDESRTSFPSAVDGRMEIHVSYSTLHAIRVSRTDYAYLVFGKNTKTKEHLFALCAGRHSIARVHNSWSVPYNMTDKEALCLMPLIQDYLIALATISDFSSGETLILLEPTIEIGQILSRLAAEKGVKLVLMTTRDSIKGEENWITIHPSWPSRVIKSIMPQAASCLIVCSDMHDWAAKVTPCLPPNCMFRGPNFFTSQMSKLDSFSSMAFIPSVLRSAFIHAHHDAVSKNHSIPVVVPVKDIAYGNAPTNENTLISWTLTDTVPVRVAPVDTQPLFSSDKTYWLVGLTGGLGLSLCEWMVENGARHIVLSSRNPKVEPRWEQYMRSQGAVIKLYSSDISDGESVRSLYKKICEELPPIGGVAQGAMVLADAMFIDLDLEQVKKVVAPKVTGSNHLAQLFHDVPLEFFVFLSSMANVSGNPGQSIYAAANSYMNTLMATRRKRGLAASAINLGTVYGRGYVTEHLTKDEIDYLYKQGNMPMSEETFHQIFAEAVIASRQDATDSPEIMTGLRKAVDGTGDENIVWFHNPKFSHHVVFPDAQGADTAATKQNVTVRAQLLLATTTEEIREAIEEGFIAKLRSSLQIEDPAASVLTMNAEQLGLDSLVAVELRSWFIKELKVEIPVLKILGGFTVSELAAAAQETLPDTLIPNFGKETDPTPRNAVKAKSQQQADISKPNPVTLNDESAFALFEEDEDEFEADTSPDLQASQSSRIKYQHDPGSTFEQRSFNSKPVTFSSDANSLDSDSENSSTRKISALTPATSVSYMDNYFSKNEDVGLTRAVPMSFGQARFWFLKSFIEDQTAFNITTSIRLNGHLNIGNFRRAVRALGRRHEALRTSFFTDKDGQPMQGVLREAVLELQHKYIRSEDEISIEYAKIKNHVYDLGRGELMQIVLLTLREDLHQFIIGYHHINMDGMSLEVILSDLQQFYYGQRPAALVPQYPDYSQLKAKEHSSGQWNREIAFWRSEFSEIPKPLPILPLSRKATRSPLSKYGSNNASFKLDAAVARQIEHVCSRTKTSPFNFYLAVFKVLLHRYIGEESSDVCIGMADGGRNIESVEGSVGFFLNLLPLRFNTESSQSFNDTLKEARSKVIAALANSRIPFDVLINEVHAPRDPTHSPLFQAFINYRHIQDQRQWLGCVAEGTQFDSSQTAYDISIDIIGNPGGESAIYVFGQNQIYSKDAVEIISQSYHNLIKAFAKNPALRLGRPSLHDPITVQRALDRGVGPSQPHLWPETLVHRVDDMIEAHGSSLALKTPRSRLTYNQMADRVHAIASTLKSSGLARGSRIAIFQDPGLDLFCSVLAIFRIGALFIPLEPRQGLPRLAVMVKDSEAEAIVFDKPNQKDLAALGSSFKKINVSLVPAKVLEIVRNDAAADEPAVILYTSGTTGTPKGMLLTHSAWLNQIASSTQVWQIATGTGIHLQHSAWSFDIALSQTFVALANGGTLFVVPKERRGDSAAISNIIVSEEVNYTQATPSELVSWLQHADPTALRASKWRFAMSGGERMTSSLIQEFRKLAKPDLRLVNAYGPAEIALAVGSIEVEYELDDNLDTPFALFPNYSVYILDSAAQAVPAGIPGEIYIGGAGVAQGYLNNESLSKERFLPDEFAPDAFIAKSWKTMHKTGDMGRLTEDGSLVVGGRTEGDTQVKIRGIRVDLRDIESTLVQEAKGDITDAVVTVRTSGATEFFVAHMIIRPNFHGNRDDLLARILRTLPLPQYMRPTLAIPLEHLPRNHSGKVDRRTIGELPLKLPNKEATASAQQRDNSETQLKDIWEQVLGSELMSLQQIDYDSDFFHLGGSSLALVKIQGLIKKVFSVDLSLVKLFENSTFGAMVRHIDPTRESAEVVRDSSAIDSLMPDVNPKNTSTSAGHINWEQETALTDDIYAVEINSEPRDQGLPFKTVLITGATGFLGKELVRQMIDDTHVDKIHAVAVRRRKSDLPAIFSHPKVELHHGDLNAPRLGITEAKARDLFAEIDAVIHNGADVSFLKTYRTLSKTNVGSTRELLKLSLPNRIPIHFVSSASVAHLSGRTSFGEESVGAFEPAEDGTDGYTATKWASERLLELVSEKFSVPIWIHRPSSITGDDAPDLDLMTNILTFSKKMNKVPVSPAWRGTLDFVSVERAAAEILDEVKNDSANGDGLVKYVYESGDVEIAIQDMQTSLEQQTGERFEGVSVDEWTTAAVAEGLDQLVAAYLDSASEVPLVFPKLLRADRKRRVSSETKGQENAGQPDTWALGLRGFLGRWSFRG